MKTSPLIVIVGPTASGKSGLAMEVAQGFNGEIICADSRTVYKEVDIGTAKPTKEERLKIRHHLLDVASPDQKFNAADFKRLANEAIEDVSKRGKLPILVGGTGLYVDAVIFDYKFSGKIDESERLLLEKLKVEQLQEICRKNNIELPTNNKNKRHLIRVIQLRGVNKEDKVLRENTLVVGITTKKDVLTERVRERAVHMFKSGVLEETKGLGKKYGWDKESLTGNIYRVCRRVIYKEMTLDSAIDETLKSDLALVKRQMTWFRRNPAIFWGTSSELLSRIRQFVVKN